MASLSNQTGFQCPINIYFNPTNNASRTEPSVSSWIPLAVNIVTSPPTVLINFLVIWTVLVNEQLRSTNYYLLVTILSLGDLLVGLVVQPLFIAVAVATIFQYSHLCELIIVSYVCVFLCSGLSVVTMVVVSVERYLYMEYPLYYPTLVTSKKLMIITAATWILTCIAFFASRFLWNNSLWASHIPVILTGGFSTIIIIFCTTKISLTVRRQMRAIAAQQQPTAQQSKIKEYKRTITLGLTLLASVACMCPILIMEMVGAVKGNTNDDHTYLPKATYVTCLNLQSLINPIIYSLRLSDIRTGIAKRLCCNRQ